MQRRPQLVKQGRHGHAEDAKGSVVQYADDGVARVGEVEQEEGLIVPNAVQEAGELALESGYGRCRDHGRALRVSERDFRVTTPCQVSEWQLATEGYSPGPCKPRGRLRRRCTPVPLKGTACWTHCQIAGERRLRGGNKSKE